MSEYDDKKPFKSMIEWQDFTFDTISLRSFDQQTLPDPEHEDGVSYALILRFNGSPYEKIFRYRSEEVRQEAITSLRAKLMMNNVNLT